MSLRGATVRVLARPAFSNRKLNPYNARIYQGIEDFGVSVTEYSMGRALFGRYDILHVHWPESSFNHGLWGARFTTESLLVALRRAKARGAQLVWTMHNLRAHEGRYPGPEEEFWARYLPLVDGVIALSPTSLERARAERPSLVDKRAFVVRHPHYRGEYLDGLSRSTARARLDLPEGVPVLAYFGQIKAYKNVPALVQTVRGMKKEVILLVAGKVRDAELANEVQACAGGDPRIRLALRHVDSDEAQVFFRAADLVVLPYRDILNSGSALLGLSFDRPVWLPADGPAGALAVDLQAAVGGQWVTSGTLGAEPLYAALEAAKQLPERTDGEHLTAFAPRTVTRQTAEVFRTLARDAEANR